MAPDKSPVGETSRRSIVDIFLLCVRRSFPSSCTRSPPHSWCGRSSLSMSSVHRIDSVSSPLSRSVLLRQRLPSNQLFGTVLNCLSFTYVSIEEVSSTCLDAFTIAPCLCYGYGRLENVHCLTDPISCMRLSSRRPRYMSGWLRRAILRTSSSVGS